MCNTYVIRPKRGAQGLAQRVSEATTKLASALVRKSDPGVVVRAGDAVEIMRWGFHREFNPSINNARADKLEGGMWQDSFHERRCVIPMSVFYEWGPGLGGRKQAHEFRDPDDDYLWAAGIWEEHPGVGPCYSMITTAASPVMSAFHDRMPALLRAEEMQEWLAGSGRRDFQPFPRAAGGGTVRQSVGEESGWPAARGVVLMTAGVNPVPTHHCPPSLSTAHHTPFPRVPASRRRGGIPKRATVEADYCSFSTSFSSTAGRRDARVSISNSGNLGESVGLLHLVSPARDMNFALLPRDSETVDDDGLPFRFPEQLAQDFASPLMRLFTAQRVPRKFDPRILCDADELSSGEGVVHLLAVTSRKSHIAQPLQRRVRCPHLLLAVAIQQGRELEDVLDDPVECLAPAAEIITRIIRFRASVARPLPDDRKDRAEVKRLSGRDMRFQTALSVFLEPVSGWLLPDPGDDGAIRDVARKLRTVGGELPIKMPGIDVGTDPQCTARHTPCTADGLLKYRGIQLPPEVVERDERSPFDESCRDGFIQAAHAALRCRDCRGELVVNAVHQLLPVGLAGLTLIGLRDIQWKIIVDPASHFEGRAEDASDRARFVGGSYEVEVIHQTQNRRHRCLSRNVLWDLTPSDVGATSVGVIAATENLPFLREDWACCQLANVRQILARGVRA